MGLVNPKLIPVNPYQVGSKSKPHTHKPIKFGFQTQTRNPIFFEFSCMIKYNLFFSLKVNEMMAESDLDGDGKSYCLWFFFFIIKL
jgi:hypothetical protein